MARHKQQWALFQGNKRSSNTLSARLRDLANRLCRSRRCWEQLSPFRSILVRLGSVLTQRIGSQIVIQLLKNPWIGNRSSKRPDSLVTLAPPA
jgi:hypothetical protein